MKTPQCRFSLKTLNDTSEMVLYGIVGDSWDDMDAANVVDAIRGVATPKLIVKVHSEGGSVLDGIAIYNAFKEYKGELTFQVDSFAASMASIIITAGSVVMYENAFLLVHNPWLGIAGDADELRKAAMNLEKFTEVSYAAYEAKTKLPREKIKELMDAETLLTAKEAKELGFCDKIIAGGSTTAMAKVMNMTKKETPKMTITLEELRTKHPDIVAQLIEEGRKKEADRIADVQAQAVLPGHESVIKAMMFDGKSTGADAAKVILAAEAKARVTASQALASDLAEIPVVPVSAVPAVEATVSDAEPTDEVSAKAVWEKKPTVREEFGTFDTYLAYIQNKHNVKRLVRREK